MKQQYVIMLNKLNIFHFPEHFPSTLNNWNNFAAKSTILVLKNLKQVKDYFFQAIFCLSAR